MPFGYFRLELFGQYNTPEGVRMTLFKWDRGLDYEDIKGKLTRELDLLRSKKPLYEKDKVKYTYLLLGLIQLRNGCRVGEAIEGLLKFIRIQEQEVYVKVEKRKDNAMRKLILPMEISTKDLELVKDIVLRWKKKPCRRVANNVASWYLRNLGINTHSLRYAYISYLGKKQYPAQIIASITGHKKLDMILGYTQSKIAEDVLRREK